MTADEFRSIALGFSDASEGSHMGHPDFRVHGKIFATLHYPDENWGMVKLPPEEQHTFVHAHPEVFVPAKRAWGRQGSTKRSLGSGGCRHADSCAGDCLAKCIGKTSAQFEEDQLGSSSAEL